MVTVTTNICREVPKLFTMSKTRSTRGERRRDVKSKVEEEIEKPKPFNFKRLINIKMDGHYLKTLNSKPYTGRDQIL